MAHRYVARVAALLAISFLVGACANTEQAARRGPTDIATPAGVAEFHGAAIGADTLRSRLQAE